MSLELWNFWAGKNDVKIQRDIKRLYELIEQNQCRRCWERLLRGSDLWCEWCRKLVDEEMHWEISRPFNFYFEHYNKWKSNVENVGKK